MKTKNYILHTLVELKQKRDSKILFDAIWHYPQWKKTKKDSNRKSIKDFLPWLNFNVISFLKTELNENMMVFEYGSGSSTIYLSSKVKSIVSVEHDKEWYLNVKKLLNENDISNVDYKFIAPQILSEDDIKLDFENPGDYYSSDENFKNASFENYVKVIDEYPDNNFDLVIVDGRVRPSCIMHALNKIKIGGYLLVDNVEREYYLNSVKELGNIERWTKQVFTAHVPGLSHYCSTAVLRKNV